MDNANQNRQLNNATRRSKSPLGWAIGAVFFAVLLGLLAFYYGFTDKFNDATGSDSTKPNATSQQPSK
jgi:hypothetical protein